jgi:uncharacterized protein
MKIEFDPAKREATLLDRGLDFLDAPRIFDGVTQSAVDSRIAYGETRWITYGKLDGRFVVLVHTMRGDNMRIISMRHAHQEEIDDAGFG